MNQFCEKYPSRIGKRILLYTKNYQKDEVVTYLLMYYMRYLKIPILCNKYAVLHKKVCFLCNGMNKLKKSSTFVGK